MKKLRAALLLSSALLVSAAAQAQWEGNWLVGLSGGYSWGNGDVDYSSFKPATTPIVVNASNNLDSKDWLWGLLGGYQVRCNGWLLGAELNFDWQGHHNNQNFNFAQTGPTVATNLSADFKRDVTVGLTGRMGLEVSPWLMPYIRLGAETSEDKLSFSSAEIGTGVNNSATGSGSHRSWRFIGGVGAELPVPGLTGLTFRAEYNYHSKGSAVNVNTVASDNITAVTVSTKQHANSGKASLVWNFI
jgi:opacity protein-like surface antigen